MKAIVLYYSKSGTTEKLAERVCNDLECNKIKIEPAEKYGSYISAVLRVAKENRKHITPEFVTEIPNLTGYSVILLGYPIWYQDMPAFVTDFIRQCDLTGKTVIPFATFGTTGVKWSMKTLEGVCKGAEIKLPFDYGIMKKDNYCKWIENIQELLLS